MKLCGFRQLIQCTGRITKESEILVDETVKPVSIQKLYQPGSQTTTWLDVYTKQTIQSFQVEQSLIETTASMIQISYFKTSETHVGTTFITVENKKKSWDIMNENSDSSTQ